MLLNELLPTILLLIVLILLNAAFACAEIAVISVSPAKLKKMAEEGDKKAKKLIALTDQPARFLATIQIAITLAGLLQSAFAAENFADPLVGLLTDDIGMPGSEEVLKPVVIVIITLVLAYFTLVFGELIPKRVAMKKSETLAMKMAGPLYAISIVFAPLVWLLTVSTNGVLRLFGMNPNENDEKVTEEEIRMMLEEGSEQGTIQEEETEIIQNVFEFNDTTVEEICTHRREIVLLSVEDSEEEWAEIINANRHTFYPVCGEDSEDVIGILDTRDYFRTDNKSKENLMQIAMDKPFFVPDGMKANILFRKMKEQHKYFAVIMDEYGALSGIITLHDLLEALVGDLKEEPEEEPRDDVNEIGENLWKIQGCASLSEVSEELGIEFSEDYDTFGGYVCDIIGRIPDDGEKFTCETEEMIIEVHEVENRMIGETTVSKKIVEEEEKEKNREKKEKED